MTRKQLQTLQKKWYRKLAKTGFVDAEANPETDNPYLKRWDSKWFADLRPSPASGTMHLQERESDKNQYFFTKQEYFYKAQHFLTSHEFDNKLEKRIWELHVAGNSLSETSRIVKVYRDKIRAIVKKLKLEMLRGPTNNN